MCFIIFMKILMFLGRLKSVLPGNLLNVTAFINWEHLWSADIYQDEVTWFDAHQLCSKQNRPFDVSYDTSGYMTTIIKQVLRDNNHTGNISFWGAYFRPSVLENDWYRTNSDGRTCYNEPVEFSNRPGYYNLCSVWHYLANGTVHFAADNCSMNYAYYCHSVYTTQEISFHEYSGWSYVETSLPTEFCRILRLSTNSIDSCREYCIKWSFCVAFTYRHDNSMCYRIVMRPEVEDIAHVSYTIEELPNDTVDAKMTHGLKGPYNVTFHPKSDSELTETFQQAFPVCNFTDILTTRSSTSSTNADSTLTTTRNSEQLTNADSTLTTTRNSEPLTNADSTFTTTTSSTSSVNTDSTITATRSSASSTNIDPTIIASTSPPACVCYQKCSLTSNTTQMEESIAQIIRNLTISRKITSKYKRKFLSAEDERASSKVMGMASAVIIIVAVISIICLDYSAIVYTVILKVYGIFQIKNNKVHTHCSNSARLLSNKSSVKR